jgi:hypothetical protein
MKLRNLWNWKTRLLELVMVPENEGIGDGSRK